MNNLICWHDGEYKLLRDVSITPLDFGFIHSDATYDVLRIKNGKIMFLDLHLERFSNSGNYFYFSPIADIQSIAHVLIEKNNIKDAFLWLTSWRGAPPTGHPRDVNAPQHNLIYVKPYYGISDTGINLCIDKENKRTPDVVHNQEYKNFSWIEFNRAQRNSVIKGYDSALLLTVDNFISEGPGFGVCFVKNNTVLTPAKDCLKSVTIAVVEQLCLKMNIKFQRCNITEEEALSSDEAFICSTSGGITFINKLNDKIYSHRLTEKLKIEYNNIG